MFGSSGIQTTADWHETIYVTLGREGFPAFHRLTSGEVVDDLGRSGSAFVPDWAEDSLTPNGHLLSPSETAKALAALLAGDGSCGSTGAVHDPSRIG